MFLEFIKKIDVGKTAGIIGNVFLTVACLVMLGTVLFRFQPQDQVEPILVPVETLEKRVAKVGAGLETVFEATVQLPNGKPYTFYVNRQIYHEQPQHICMTQSVGRIWPVRRYDPASIEQCEAFS